MCRSPSGFEQFHLEKENIKTIDVTNTSSSKIAARFSLGPMSKDTAGGYSCFYKIKNTWSPCSEILVLEVICEDITWASLPVSEVTSSLFPGLWSFSFIHHLDCLGSVLSWAEHKTRFSSLLGTGVQTWLGTLILFNGMLYSSLACCYPFFSNEPEPIDGTVICDSWYGFFPLSLSHGPGMVFEQNCINFES